MTVTVPEVGLAEVLADPVGVAEQVRPEAWCVRTEEGLVVLDHGPAEAVLQDESFVPGIHRILELLGLAPEDMTGGGRTMLLSEGPDHTVLRRAVGRWFTPRRVAELAEEVRELADQRLDAVAEAGGGDYLRDVSTRVPGTVFCRLIGADPSYGDRAYELATVLLRSFEGNPELADAIFAAAGEMRELVDDLLAVKRRNPGDDLLSLLLDGEAEALTEQDVHAIVIETLGASTETTAHSSALGVARLGAAPDQWARVVADPGLAPQAVEETLRVEPAVLRMRSHPPADTELLGVPVAAGEPVILAVPAAHHDPAVYPDPHRFDVTRTLARPPLTFGIGRHYCLGAALARMELRVLLEALAARGFELAGDVEIDREESAMVRSLPITVGAR